MEMIFAINIESYKESLYTTKSRHRNNTNGEMPYAGFPKESKHTKKLPTLPVSEKDLDVMVWKSFLADNCRIMWNHHYNNLVYFEWVGRALVGNNLPSLERLIPTVSPNHVFQLELLGSLAKSGLPEEYLLSLFVSATYLYTVHRMYSCDRLSAL